MKTLSLIAILAMILTLSAGTGLAELVIHESFLYPSDAGTLLYGQTATGKGLSGTWGSWRTTASLIVATNSSLTYGSLVTSNRQVQLVYRGFGQGDDVTAPLSTATQNILGNNGSTYWYSVIVRTPASYETGRQLRLYYDRGSTYLLGGFRINDTGTLQAMVGSAAGTASAAIPANTNILVIMKITRARNLNYVTNEVWYYDTQVVPSSAPADGTGSAVVADPGTGNLPQTFKFQAYVPGNGQVARPFIVDEFRGGTTFADVVPVIPEPAFIALLALGGLLLRKQF